MLEYLKQKLADLKREIQVLYLAYKHEKCPWYAKVTLACLLAYAFSPIDLIPDFIPVIGYLDDAIILPLGVIVVRRLIPDVILAECRQKVMSYQQSKKQVSIVGACIVILLWVAVAAIIVLACIR